MSLSGRSKYGGKLNTVRENLYSFVSLESVSVTLIMLNPRCVAGKVGLISSFFKALSNIINGGADTMI